MDRSIVFGRWCQYEPHASLGPPNGTSTGSAIFAQLTVESTNTLQWGAPFPLKIAPTWRDLDTI